MVNLKERKDPKGNKAERIISDAMHIALTYDRGIVDGSGSVQSLVKGKEKAEGQAIIELEKDLALVFFLPCSGTISRG